METNEIKVENCNNCPFAHYPQVCDGEDMQVCAFQDTLVDDYETSLYNDGKLPEKCPLKNTNVSISLKTQ